MRDELETIVRELAGMDPMQDIETAYVCFACNYWEPRRNWPDDGDERPTEHQARCVWRKARQAVERLDEARQPVEAHIRFSRALNQGHRRTEG